MKERVEHHAQMQGQKNVNAERKGGTAHGGQQQKRAEELKGRIAYANATTVKKQHVWNE